MSLDTFEQSLLHELRRHVAARAPAAAVRPVGSGRRTGRIALGGFAAAAVGVVTVSLSLGTGVAGPTAAYAVESQPNGDVVVSVHALADADGLEHALAAKGILAVVRHVPGFVQSAGQHGTSATSDPGSCDIRLAKVDDGLRFTLGAAQIAAGSTLDIVTSGSDRTDVGSPVAVTWSGGGC